MAAWIRAVSGRASSASDRRPPGAVIRASSVAQAGGATGSSTCRRSWAASGAARSREATARPEKRTFIV